MATKKVTKKSSKKVAKKPDKAMAAIAKAANRVPLPAASQPKITTPSAAPAVPRRTPVTKGRLLGISERTTNQRNADLTATVNKLNEEFGENTVVPASMANSNSFLRRPSGIMQLDVDTGGGLPAASFCTIGGPDNSGKSTLLYHYFAMHQRLYGQDAYCALAAPEGELDYIQARRCGWVVPVPEKVIEAKDAELFAAGMPALTNAQVDEFRREVGRNVFVKATTMEGILDAVDRLLAKNLFGLVAIDSYESMLPKAEAELDSYEDNAQRAMRASLITRFFQNYGPTKKSSAHWTTFLMTTQVRSNPNKALATGPMAKFVKPYSGDAAAFALKHWRDIDVVLDTGEKHREGPKEKAIVIGKDVTWHLAKGKNGAHDNVRGRTPYYYDERCFDALRTVIVAGFRYGLIREEDGFLTFYKNGAPDDYLYRIPGPDNFMLAMAEEPESEWDLRRAICLAAGVSATYR